MECGVWLFGRALMMLSPDRIAFVKSFFELFITFSTIRSVHILLGPALAGAGPHGDGLAQSFQQPFQMRHALAEFAKLTFQPIKP